MKLKHARNTLLGSVEGLSRDISQVVEMPLWVCLIAESWAQNFARYSGSGSTLRVSMMLLGAMVGVRFIMGF